MVYTVSVPAEHKGKENRDIQMINRRAPNTNVAVRTPLKAAQASTPSLPASPLRLILLQVCLHVHLHALFTPFLTPFLSPISRATLCETE